MTKEEDEEYIEEDYMTEAWILRKWNRNRIRSTKSEEE